MLEAYDPEVQGRSQIRRQGEGGRIGADRRKTEPEKRRTKAAGGGKTAPAKPYKKRSDVGTQRPRSTREQQPTRERGSAALSAKAAQKKAYLERKKRESATKDEASGKDKRIDLKKSADKLLTKKTTKSDPKYKATGKGGYGGPSKKSYSHQERHALRRKGEKVLRDLRLKNLGKKSEKELKHKIVSK